MTAGTNIWRVSVEDDNYHGNRATFLFAGKSAAEVEKKALAKATKDWKTLKSETRAAPYVRSIDLVGTLNG